MFNEELKKNKIINLFLEFEKRGYFCIRESDRSVAPLERGKFHWLAHHAGA